MITGDVDVVLTIRFSTPPGITGDQAMQQIFRSIGIPLGLANQIRNVDLSAVPAENAVMGLVKQ